MYASGVHHFSKCLLYYSEHIIALGFYPLQITGKKGIRLTYYTTVSTAPSV